MGRNVRVFPTINLAHPDLAGGTAQQLSPSLLPIPCKKKMVPPEEKCHSQSCWDKILILAGQQEQEWVRVACLCVGWWMAVGGYGGEGSMGHSTPLPKDIVLRARRGEDIAVGSFEMLQGEMWENPSSTLFLVLSLLFIPEPC